MKDQFPYILIYSHFTSSIWNKIKLINYVTHIFSSLYFTAGKAEMSSAFIHNVIHIFTMLGLCTKHKVDTHLSFS